MQNKKNNGSVQPSAMESDQDFQDRVARKAYELFEDRGQAPGDDVEDGLRRNDWSKGRAVLRRQGSRSFNLAIGWPRPSLSTSAALRESVRDPERAIDLTSRHESRY